MNESTPTNSPTRKRLPIGRLVVGCIIVVLVGGYFGWDWDDLFPQDAQGPGRLVEGRIALQGRSGFAFIAQTDTPAEAGDLQFDDESLVLRAGRGNDGGERFIKDMGPMQLAELSEAPRLGYGRDAAVTVGHVYALRLKGDSRVLYARIRVVQVQPRIDGGLFGKDTPGSIAIEYALQLNGGRSFRTGPADGSPGAVLAARRDRLKVDREALEQKLTTDLPQLRLTLTQQARVVTEQRQSGASREADEVLARELRDIARMAVALDRHEQKIKQTLVIIDSSVRNLTRRIASEMVLGADADRLLEETAQIERDSAALLEVKLTDAGVSDTFVDEQAVNEKLRELSSGQ